MVHRAPDSRLLTNLIVHEKEYTKHLAGLFPLSHSALTSLSAYAAASPSHPSSPAQTISAVVDVLAGADDALQRYNHAVDTWRAQLVALKDLEDDLTAILRDRDIFVTRLIKASKSTREAHRSSRLMVPLAGVGSASFSSLPSTNSANTGSLSGPASTNAKLAQAQAELQACETHLVTKERELDARRLSVAREGLGARCRALIDCGWVWSEMGKQGLKALQALVTSSVASNGRTAIPPHLGLNPTTYASDNSSLTPSQSASQTATRSVETSHEAPTSKERKDATELETESETKPHPPIGQARAAPAEEEEDLTITLPPAHAISELAFPTGVRSQPPQSGDLAAQKQTPDPAPAPRRKRTKRSRRPPSQHITEVSDEGSEEPSTIPNRNVGTNVGVNANPLVSRTPFPTTHTAPGTHDTSSEEEHPIGPFEVVENDPFEVIRRSMLGPSVSALFLPTAPSVPSAFASVPDVRGSETSPSKAALQSSSVGPGQGTGLTPGSGLAKRERRASMAFFGSLRGLFRKPKDRERLAMEWDEDHSSPSPSSPNRTKGKANRRGGGGWVTRTDARIKGEENSDEEPRPTRMATATPDANMARRDSAARLRKGRPGSPLGNHGNRTSPSIPVTPPHRANAGVGMDGWITDSQAGAGAGTGQGGSTRMGKGAGQGRSGTRRGIMKRKKTSVADLRGSDQGHTDGEVGERQLLERASVSGRRPEVDERKLARSGSTPKGVPTDTTPIADPGSDVNATPGISPRRAATTTATSSRKPSSHGVPAHRRSASLSLADMHVASVSTSTQETRAPTSTGGTASWRKPPPPVEPPSRSESPSQSQTPSQTPSRTQTELQPKQNTRRPLSNGHATHANKHAQNQSLMSIVADVTRQNQNQNEDLDLVWLGTGVGTDKAKSMDIPRAPGSVLREVERDRDWEPSGTERGVGTRVNSRGHARTSSSPTAMDEGGRDGVGGQGKGQGQGGQRPIKLPLRSALRNASRTPSPSPALVPVPVPVPAPVVVPAGTSLEVRKEGVVQADTEHAHVEEARGRGIASPSLRDSASISSYETGRESFDVEEGERVSSPSPRLQSHLAPSQSRSPTPRSHTPPPLSFTFPPPPVDPPPASVPAPAQGETGQSDPNPNTTELPCSSNVSTETPPVRRKSVRVSLQPTFSPTPPALYDEDDQGYAPWSKSFSMRDEGETEGERKEESLGSNARERKGRKTKRGERGGAQEDVWADSSDEDEAYSRARRLLSLVGKHDEGKGKGKARAKT